MHVIYNEPYNLIHFHIWFIQTSTSAVLFLHPMSCKKKKKPYAENIMQIKIDMQIYIILI